MAKVCVIDVDRLSDKDLAGDSDFASFINNVKKYQDKYCFVCYNKQVKVYATTKKLSDLVLHLPSIYGSVLCVNLLMKLMVVKFHLVLLIMNIIILKKLAMSAFIIFTTILLLIHQLYLLLNLKQL